MSHLVIKAKALEVNKWSGGTTTQLFIWPETSTYKEGNYLARISTATVTQEETVYTPLTEVARTLMVLEGEITLTHKDQHTSRLLPYDIDQFQGDWHTSCMGTAINFNLMTKGRTQGTINPIQLQPNTAEEIKMNSNLMVIYSIDEAIISYNNDLITLEKGDTIIFREVKDQIIKVQSSKTAHLAVVTITL